MSVRNFLEDRGLSKSVVSEAILVLLLALVPGWWTISPPLAGDTGILGKLYDRRFLILLVWVFFAVAATADALYIAAKQSRRQAKAEQVTINDGPDEPDEDGSILANRSLRSLE